MRYANLIFSDEARLLCMRGIGAVADAAKVTFGPKGRTVLLDRVARQPRSTSQAAVVMGDFHLENTFENFGAELVRHAALSTHAQAGDGATTCILLTRAIARSGVKAVATGHDAVCVARGIKEAIAMVDLYLHALGRPVVTLDQLVGVALSASHGDARMAKALADAAWHTERAS
ncbi:MAG: TCP-1/cpn60 chaperonin family protein, partial [Thermomicrobiales bacterium]